MVRRPLLLLPLQALVLGGILMHGPVACGGPASAPPPSPLTAGPSSGAAADPARSSDEAFAQAMLRQVNQARAQKRQCGDESFAAAPPLRWNAALARAARQHAADLASRRRLDHQGRDGSSPADRVARQGYEWSLVAENIAYDTHGGLEQILSGWLQSPSHCANLMNPEVQELGAAVDGIYWVQVFARPL